MSTIKFVPMEFFAQFGLTQMRRLQARGAVGAAFSGAGRGWWAQVAVCTAFPARGAYCERWALSARLSGSGAGLAIVGSPFAGVGRCRRGFFWCVVAVGGRRSLFVRLSRRRVPIVNAGRCRRGFPGAGTSLADVESCWWTWGAACGRGALSAGAGALSAGAGRRLRSFFRRAGAPPRLAHAPALPRGARCLPLGLPFGCTSPALPPRRVPLRRLTFPHKDATIILLFAAAWPSAERLTGCGAVW